MTSQKILFLNSSAFLKITLLTLISLTVFVITGNEKAQAATLQVDSNCTLSEAIAAQDAAVDQNGCVKTGAAYGTDDTINMAAGTISLGADLPDLPSDTSITIAGAGVAETTINAGGFAVFVADGEEQDYTFKDFLITNAAPRAIEIAAADHAVLDHVDVADSQGGISIVAFHTNISSVNIHDCDTEALQGSQMAGLSIGIEVSDVANPPTLSISDSKIYDNNAYAGLSGLNVWGSGTGQVVAATADITIQRTSVLGNTSRKQAGMDLGLASYQNELQLTIDAVTVANNVVTETESTSLTTYVSGVYVKIVNLADGFNFTNVTVANNVATNTGNAGDTVAGLFGIFFNPSSPVSMVNTTVIGNTVTQTNQSATSYSSLFMLKYTYDPQAGPIDFAPGATSQNGLFAGNTRNGGTLSCGPVDKAMVGLTGMADATPADDGHNITDDSKCTGYAHEPTLYDTLEHEARDNGGNVPTVALLDGSPAINAGGQVLSVSTDARGVSRQGYNSAGAYQGVLAAATATPTVAKNGTLAETGIVAISATLLACLLLGSLAFAYRDYRKHRAPLKAIDPHASYSFAHHIKVVTVPLLKYRMRIQLQKVTVSDQVHRF